MDETGKDAGVWNARPPLIVLAEDSETNVTTLASYLRWLGAQVEVAHDGVEVVEMTRRLHPDVVLMDIQMPRLDGLGATHQLRADAVTAAVPIIVQTAFAMPGDRERCLAAGATAYLSKPVRLRRLKQTIERYLPQLAPQTNP
ncbi:MAG: response regulator [Anaerolineales bacterium]